MSEELNQRDLIKAPEKIGSWFFYNIGATTLKQLKEAKIIPNKSYTKYEKNKPDALIIKKPQVIAVIEHKQPSELKTKQQIDKAINQEIDVARALDAKIYIVTDGTKTFWINPLTGNDIKTECGNSISLIFSKDNTECVKLISKIISSINDKNDKILSSIVVDPLPLAQRVWQDLWSVSGATPENCLYTFVEIFIFKYLSDLGVLKGRHSFDDLLSMYNTNSESDVIEYYASIVRPEIKKKFPKNHKDKTTIINGTIFVSKDDVAVAGYATVFQKILNRFKAFGTLENIDYDFKSKLFETFLKESISKKNWGQYFTPLKVVRSVVSMADITAGMKICDPACGVGKFLLEPVLHDLHKYFKIENGKLKPQITLCGFDKGFDKDEQKTIILAKANMLIYLSGLIKENPDLTTDFAQLFNDTFLLQSNSILGTLAKPIEEEYDIILTNPPYVMSGSSNLKEEIAKQDELKRYFSISAMGIEGLFMEWIVRALKQGGKAFIVVPDGIMNRTNDKRLRDFILDECYLDAVISLPLNTFFTTNKKTYIMALTKKDKEMRNGVEVKSKQITPVFTYLCSEIGETRDTYRFDIDQNDLDTATTLYNMFKGVPDKFKVDDKRCKVVSIDEFYNGSHWSVERWWTREERINLGIEDEDNTITIDDFSSLVEDISSTLLEYKDLISGNQKKKDKSLNISITDDEYFDILSSSQLNMTKTEMVALAKGKIPVYSAAKEPILHIKEQPKPPIYASFEKPIISFANDGDGSAGRNFVLHIEPFYISASRTAIIIKDKNIISNYVLSQLIDMKEKYGFNYGFKANRKNVSAVTINIPLKEEKQFDLDLQTNISENFNTINELRMVLSNRITSLNEIVVAVEQTESYNKKIILLSDKNHFQIFIGKRILHKDFVTAKGDIPIYSANVFEPFAFSDKSNINDFSKPYVLWGIDGDFNFNYMEIGNSFGTTDHCGAIKILDKNISPEYLMYALRLVSHKYGFDRGLRASLTNMKKVEIEIPVDSNGNFDLKVQQEIAKKYIAVEQYKKEIINKLASLAEQKIEY